MELEHSVVIARPLAEVFAFVTDLDNEVRWQPEIEAVVLDGPLATGSSFREIRRSFGCRFVWDFRVTAYDPPHHITIETLAGTLPYAGTRAFEAVPGGTRVRERGQLELPGLLRPFEPVLARLCRRPLRIAYERLRVMLEAET